MGTKFRLPSVVAGVVAGLFLSGCGIVAPTVPYTGWLYSDVTAPLDITFDETRIGPDSGMTESVSICGLVAFGDASANAAARNGRLVEVNHIDYSYFTILGIYNRMETTAWGYKTLPGGN